MFIHNLDPIIFSIGPIAIRWYGLAYLLGFLFVWYTLSKNKEELKLTKQQVSDLAFWLMMGVIIGSRLYSVFIWNPSYYLSQPWKILAVWEGGMAFHGGVIGIFTALYLYCKKHKLRILHVADVIAIPVVFALALGRIANFINGELYGPITDLPWCVQFPDAEGCRHPYQIYAAIKRFAVVGILVLLKQSKHKEGFLFFTTVLLLGIGRFTLDFLREDVLYAGLSTGQWSSIAMVAVALYFFARKGKLF